VKGERIRTRNTRGFRRTRNESENLELNAAKNF
jgi:hypothetical protein